MALVNFTLPYQSVTMAPFLYADSSGSHTTTNSLRLSDLLPSRLASSYNERESFRNEPYALPIKYHQQRYSQTTQQKSHEIYTEHTSMQDNRYTVYNQDIRRTQPRQQQQQQQQQQQIKSPASSSFQQRSSEPLKTWLEKQENYPDRSIGYRKVNDGSSVSPNTKTSIHAVLDYDDDFEDYYDDQNQNIPTNAHVTPIQGPIFLKNGSVPVVPLYSYPQLNNGTLVQIPILWTALSIALGVELRGDLVRGTPCIKKYHQLFCPTAGNTYPIERIERFIDENKALMKRMYGNFEINSNYGSNDRGHVRTQRKSREAQRHDIPDGGPRDDKFYIESEIGEEYFSKSRNTRESIGKNRSTENNRIDACESKVEIVTPYWASNSAGKIRAIVNTQHFEQAIHQEICSKSQTNRCRDDCGCEQKYKWHRLLAYEPDNDCKGIFMDWFLFPSCCVCRCDRANSNKFSSSGDGN
ncbi:protein spaetzle 3 [Monomorium pharaonis]|uniref:protein spaetzle 3-like n=1 Tax=Monomorium pharaonis TaxID=307658 RepID=UPI00063F441A|nr:protein spaetzle 3-like [Monomorium pharaonis]XP_036151015.1 protein spaetzle 3 [Monomorium pharaonis]XP_036151016.1 protein spaetzle 3 [Monomorium pharaonis]XP_036151017.1 protein spaetzle 3 [Monomorium pharaonis]XP_036151018.1 protein spaetzle 3 [Monomorium pharaonis]